MIYTTGFDYIKSQGALLQSLFANNTPLQIAATEAHRLMVKRIFEDHKDADGAEIKEPSTKPIYVNPKNSPKKFATGGKPVENSNGVKVIPKKKSMNIATDFGSERLKVKHKTKYFEGGYAEFKKIIDRDKLVLFGTMRNDFRAGIKKLDQSSWISYFKNPTNAKKADGLEDKYQGTKIFTVSKEERDIFIKILQQETATYLKNDK